LVDLETLAALDGLLWLRTGEAAADKLALSQPSISRRAKAAQTVFEVSSKKIDGEWDLLSDADLLNAERRVHQLARWNGLAPLRLEASYWWEPLLKQPSPPGWMIGLCNIVGVPRNLELLRLGIVDAWIAPAPDVPAQSDADFCTLPLSAMPVHCVVAPNHPLLKKSELSFDDLEGFPSLALPSGAYPQVEIALKAVGLWSSPVRMQRYTPNQWEGRSEAELTIGYATAMSLDLLGGSLVKLPLTLPLQSGDSLVLKRAFAERPQVALLVAELKQRLQVIQQRWPEIRLYSP